MAAKLVRNDDQLELSLTGLSKPAFSDALTKVKSTPGARFNHAAKIWELPLDVTAAQRIMHSIKPEADAAVLGWLRKAQEHLAEEVSTHLPDDAPLRWSSAGPVGHVPDLDSDEPWGLFPHQRAAISFLAEHPRAILADDMGLGKTVEAIGTCIERSLFLFPDPRPGLPRLVICPRTMKLDWAAEIEHWYPDAPVQVITASNAAKRRAQLETGITAGAWNIVNWEYIRTQVIEEERKGGGRPKKIHVMREPLLQQADWGAIIADEAHRAKNRKALQTRGLWNLTASIQLALTGTPIMNTPDELWALLHWLDPKTYSSYWAFYGQYVDYYEGHFGKIITGVRHADALRFELADKLVRRTKGQVLNLPEKIRRFVPVELRPKQRKLYADAEKKLWLEIEQEAKEAGEDPEAYLRRILIVNGAARTVRLRQIASSPALLGGPDESAKLDTAMDIIMDAGEKQLVTFTGFVDTARLLVKRCGQRKIAAEALTGQEDEDERRSLVERFQAGDIQVLVCTLGAGGEGITLTAADTAIFIERAWTPAPNHQAEDRLHRIGQKYRVEIIILEAVDTVDTGRIGPVNTLKDLIFASVLEHDPIQEVHEDGSETQETDPGA